MFVWKITESAWGIWKTETDKKKRVGEMKKKDKGFSLIELIIAIAILIILTGLLAPQFLKHIEKSRKAACLHAMDTITQEYMAGLVDLDKVPDAASAVAVLDKIISAHGGDDRGEEISSIVYAYDGLCKSGGKYRCQFVNELYSVQIECSKHGEWELDIVTLHNLLDNMNLSSYEGVVYKNLTQFFQKNSTLDSEAVSTDSSSQYGKYGSFAGVVAEELSKQGMNVKNKSWMMKKSGGGYILYLTDSKISLDDQGKSVSCKQYDITKGTITSGTVMIAPKEITAGMPYPIIRDGTFEAKEN